MKSNTELAVLSTEACYLVLFYRDGETVRPVMHLRNRPYHGDKIVEFPGGAPEQEDDCVVFNTACREGDEELGLSRIFGATWKELLLKGLKGWDLVFAKDRVEPNGYKRPDARYALVYVELNLESVEKLLQGFEPTAEADELVLDPSGYHMSVSCRDFFFPAVKKRLNSDFI